MRGGTLFSGIGAPEQSAPWVDWRWSAEIDPFASAVLAARHSSRNLGDVTNLEAEIEPIDLLVFGSPCQAFSVAGKRAGLDDPRGDLTLVGLAIAGRVRPRWLVWENVPGVLSIDGGRTFGAVLGIMGQLGYGFAYRVLDAQHFGVPQRRRRVFVVGCLGDWRAAAAVLFERESLSGNPPPSREAGEGIARPIAAGSERGSGYRNDADTADNLIASTGEISHCLNAGGMGRQDYETETLIAFTQNQAGDVLCGEIMHSLATNQNATGRNAANVATPLAVRRLTPRECERLQGFPDDFTLVQYRGKPAADGPRYKALGNSMAVPVIGWILERIRTVDALSQAEAA